MFHINTVHLAMIVSQYLVQHDSSRSRLQMLQSEEGSQCKMSPVLILCKDQPTWKTQLGDGLCKLHLEAICPTSLSHCVLSSGTPDDHRCCPSQAAGANWTVLWKHWRVDSTVWFILISELHWNFHRSGGKWMYAYHVAPGPSAEPCWLPGLVWMLERCYQLAWLLSTMVNVSNC